MQPRWFLVAEEMRGFANPSGDTAVLGMGRGFWVVFIATPGFLLAAKLCKSLGAGHPTKKRTKISRVPTLPLNQLYSELRPGTAGICLHHEELGNRWVNRRD